MNKVSDLLWKVPLGPGGGTEGIVSQIALTMAREASKKLHKYVPDLVGLTAIDAKIRSDFAFSENRKLFILRVIFDTISGVHSSQGINEKDLDFISRQLGTFAVHNLAQVASLLGSEWFGPDRITYSGQIDGQNVSWPHINKFIVDWLNTIVLPHVSEINEDRILRARSSLPEYDVPVIKASIWVLESEAASEQGTAFMMDGFGLVTCDHCLFPDTKAFQTHEPTKKFPVSVVRQNSAVDLAILKIDAPSTRFLTRGSPSGLNEMDPLLVVGHPNYRIGDSAMLLYGRVAGFRMKSGIRRIITDAAIVAGSSGGPVLDRSGVVIGVAANGSKTLSTANETEDHSVVPIDALDLL